MVEVADRAVEAAWKVRNLGDFDRRLERAARRVEERSREAGPPAMVVYETALLKSGRPADEVREMVHSFRDAFEDEEEPLTIAHSSGIMSVEGDDWFFGDGDLRVLTGRLLGQFQHRVAQYNYVDEGEVLRRWADGYDTRLFIRRRIFETEPVVGVVGGLDLLLLQHLRVAAGGNTLVPDGPVARALEGLGYDAASDDHETLARAEDVALRLDLPAPIAGEMLRELGEEGFDDYPEPPREEVSTTADGPADENVPSEGGAVSGGAAAEPQAEKPAPAEREARAETREDPASGDEPSRVQDPQASDAPGVTEEEGDAKKAAPPASGRGGDAPGSSEREDS
jgi:hypothetical protein